MGDEKKIATWTNSQRKSSWCSWTKTQDSDEGILFHSQGIAHIYMTNIPSYENYTMIRFMKNGVMYSRRIIGNNSRLAAVRHANQFIKEILAGEVE